jgi:hypothetical protein
MHFKLRHTRLVGLLAAAVAALSLTASARADTWLQGGQMTVGDCTIAASLLQNSPGTVYAQGQAVCGARHGSTTVTTNLKEDGQIVRSNSVGFSNSFGLGANKLNTDSLYACGHNWQAVVQAWISGLPYTFTTSLTPIRIC